MTWNWWLSEKSWMFRYLSFSNLRTHIRSDVIWVSRWRKLDDLHLIFNYDTVESYLKMITYDVLLYLLMSRRPRACHLPFVIFFNHHTSHLLDTKQQDDNTTTMTADTLDLNLCEAEELASWLLKNRFEVCVLLTMLPCSFFARAPSCVLLILSCCSYHLYFRDCTPHDSESSQFICLMLLLWLSGEDARIDGVTCS